MKDGLESYPVNPVKSSEYDVLQRVLLVSLQEGKRKGKKHTCTISQQPVQPARCRVGVLLDSRAAAFFQGSEPEAVDATRGQGDSATLQWLTIQGHIQTLSTHSHEREKCAHLPPTAPSTSHPRQHKHVLCTRMEEVFWRVAVGGGGGLVSPSSTD